LSLAAPLIGIHAFADGENKARDLAGRLGLPFFAIAVRRFPDGESLVTIGGGGGRAIVYCTLDDPNTKLVELLLAIGALRDAGAAEITLVAPYLGYMRQDAAFHDGEAVSQRIIGGLLGRTVERLITVDPHLHRTGRLEDAVPGTEAIAVTAAPLLAETLKRDGANPDTVIVGPDAESEQWAGAVAAPLGLEVLVGHKDRQGDRDVAVTLPDAASLNGRHVVLVDDVASSGHTLIEAARMAKAAGAAHIEALVVHALFDEDAGRAMAAAGIERVRSCDSIAHPSNAMALEPLLAKTLADAGLGETET
jgi:ribose-phosphate pyrophosphokinase